MAFFNQTFSKLKSTTPNKASSLPTYIPYSMQSQSSKRRLDSFNSIISDTSKQSELNDADDETVIHRNFLHEQSTPSIDKDPQHPIDTYFSFDGHANNHILNQSATDRDDQNSDSEELGVRYTPIHKKDTSITCTKQHYSLDDALKTLQFGRFDHILIFIISIIYFSIGIQAKITNILYFLIEHNHFVFNIPSNAEHLLYIAYGSGAVIGIYLSALSDKIGRKKIISISCISLLFFTILQLLSFNWTMLVFSRLFIGCCCAVAMISSITLLIEYVPNPYRFRIIYFIFFIGIISHAVGSLIAYIVYAASYSTNDTYIDVKHWRILMAIISIPVWLLPILNYLYLPQSPHFVALEGNTEKVMQILKIIEYYNARQSFFNLLEQQQLTIQTFDKIKRNSRGKIVSLFAFKEYRMTSLLLCLMSFAIWFVYSTIYQIQYVFAIYLQTNNTNSDADSGGSILEQISLNENFAVESIVTTCDIVATLLTLIFMNFMERKRILMFGFALSTLLCFIVMIISAAPSKAGNLLGIACIFLANMSVDICYYVLQIYMLEYYATVVRTTSLGFIFYGIGSVSSILSFTVSMAVGPSWILLMFYCLCGVVGFQCCRLLDTETKNKPLEDHIIKTHQKNLTSKVHYDYVAL